MIAIIIEIVVNQWRPRQKGKRLNHLIKINLNHNPDFECDLNSDLSVPCLYILTFAVLDMDIVVSSRIDERFSLSLSGPSLLVIVKEEEYLVCHI